MYTYKIEVRHLTHIYDDITALEDINFGVEDEKFVSIVGPSGCGKTTLLYSIAGFITPTQGEVLINGQKTRGPGADKGVVFQDYALFRWLTVQGNVEFGLKMRHIPSKEMKETAEYYLNLVGLSKFKDKYPYQLSGGMQQRVGIARALANEPEFLLMDEPFGSLDAQTRELMQEELFKIFLSVRNSILFVTHSVDEAIFLSNRIIVLTFRPGKIKTTFDINLRESEFDLDDKIRTSREFNKYKFEVSTAIREEIKKEKTLK